MSIHRKRRHSLSTRTAGQTISPPHIRVTQKQPLRDELNPEARMKNGDFEKSPSAIAVR